MDKLITTPHNFIWRVKNPQDYWADTIKEVKYNVYVNGKKRGGFIGVNRTFDDDMNYVNFYDENNKKATNINNVKFFEDYIKNNCATNCKHFLMKKIN